MGGGGGMEGGMEGGQWVRFKTVRFGSTTVQIEFLTQWTQQITSKGKQNKTKESVLTTTSKFLPTSLFLTFSRNLASLLLNCSTRGVVCFDFLSKSLER